MALLLNEDLSIALYDGVLVISDNGAPCCCGCVCCDKPLVKATLEISGISDGFDEERPSDTFCDNCEALNLYLEIPIDEKCGGAISGSVHLDCYASGDPVDDAFDTYAWGVRWSITCDPVAETITFNVLLTFTLGGGTIYYVEFEKVFEDITLPADCHNLINGDIPQVDNSGPGQAGWLPCNLSSATCNLIDLDTA